MRMGTASKQRRCPARPRALPEEQTLGWQSSGPARCSGAAAHGRPDEERARPLKTSGLGAAEGPILNMQAPGRDTQGGPFVKIFAGGAENPQPLPDA